MKCSLHFSYFESHPIMYRFLLELINPDVIYFCPGSAYITDNEHQQYPEFLTNMMKQNPDLCYMITIMDPNLEAIPDVVQHFGATEILYEGNIGEWKHYSKNNIHIVTANSNFDNLSNENCDEDPMMLSVYHVIEKKVVNPYNTYLLFFYAFMGFNYDSYRTRVVKKLNKRKGFRDFMGAYYVKCVSIGIQSVIDSSCNPPLDKESFDPILIKENGPIEICRINMLSLKDIFLLSNVARSNVIKNITQKIITKEINDLWNKYIAPYRWIRLSLDEVPDFELANIRKKYEFKDSEFATVVEFMEFAEIEQKEELIIEAGTIVVNCFRRFLNRIQVNDSILNDLRIYMANYESNINDIASIYSSFKIQLNAIGKSMDDDELDRFMVVNYLRNYSNSV